MNERIVRDSVQINSASDFYLPCLPRKCLQPDWGDNQREALIQQGGWELLASRHLMFVTAACSANTLHLFTFGSLKIETFLFSAAPIVLFQPDLIYCNSVSENTGSYFMWLPATERNLSFIIPSVCCYKAPCWHDCHNL